MRRMFIGAGLLCAILACGGGDGKTDPSTEPASVAVVQISPANDTLLVGATLRLAATAYDSTGTPLVGRTVTWLTSDSSLALVSATGLVTSVAGGAVTIRGTIEGKSATASLTLAPVVTVSRKLPSTFAGDTTLLTATLTKIGGDPLAGSLDGWTSSNPGVATVSANGVVTGLTPGRSWISAHSGAGTDSVELVVLAVPARANREIAFHRITKRFDGLDIIELRVMQPDGSGSTRISALDEYVSEDQWSPDGDRIALTYLNLNGYGKTGLFVINADGSSERLLTSDAVHPRWSPDGSRIAYRTYNGDIYSIAADGGAPKQLTSMTGDELDPEWSPDGRQIAFRRQLIFCDELWVMNSDGTRQKKVPLPVTMCNLRWSPDGKQMVFMNASGPTQRAGIWLVNADGSNPRPLSPNCSADGTCTGNYDYGSPVWSPDAKKLSFTHTRATTGYPSYLSVVSSGGSPVWELQLGPPCCVLVQVVSDWSPDGTRLVFTSRKDPDPYYPGIGTLNADGSGATLVTPDETTGSPQWRP